MTLSGGWRGGGGWRLQARANGVVHPKAKTGPQDCGEAETQGPLALAALPPLAAAWHGPPLEADVKQDTGLSPGSLLSLEIGMQAGLARKHWTGSGIGQQPEDQSMLLRDGRVSLLAEAWVSACARTSTWPAPCSPRLRMKRLWVCACTPPGSGKP